MAEDQTGNPTPFGASPYSYPFVESAGGTQGGMFLPSMTNSYTNSVYNMQMESILRATTWSGGDKRVGNMLSQFKDQMHPDLYNTLNRGGNEARQMLAAQINENPYVNRLFSGGNMDHVAMGARSLIDSYSLGNRQQMGGITDAQRVNATIGMTNTMLGHFQNDKGQINRQFGRSYEDIGGAMKFLSQGGGMTAGGGVVNEDGLFDEGSERKILGFVKGLNKSLDSLKNIYGELSRPELMVKLQEITGLDPSKLSNITTVEHSIRRMGVEAQSLGMSGAAYGTMISGGAAGLRGAGFAPHTAGLVSRQAAFASGVESMNQRDRELGAGRFGYAALTSQDVHRKQMLGFQGMAGTQEGVYLLGIENVLQDDEYMRSQGKGKGILNDEQRERIARARASGDERQIQAAATEIENITGLNIMQEGRRFSMGQRSRMLNTQSTGNWRDAMLASQVNNNKEWFKNKVLRSGSYGLSDENADMFATAYNEFGGGALSDILLKGDDEAEAMMLSNEGFLSSARKSLKGTMSQDDLEGKPGQDAIRQLARTRLADLRGGLGTIGTKEKRNFFVQYLRRTSGMGATDSEKALSGAAIAEAQQKELYLEDDVRKSKALESYLERFTPAGGGVKDFLAGFRGADFEKVHDPDNVGRMAGISSLSLGELAGLSSETFRQRSGVNEDLKTLRAGSDMAGKDMAAFLKSDVFIGDKAKDENKELKKQYEQLQKLTDALQKQIEKKGVQGVKVTNFDEIAHILDGNKD
jgi:hypothetical protein